ncbi:hypothetical protein WG66_009339 [Moniliophthora roreri]|nr:hypothetical protein WG66_009339 [Moniliophthora roreri]
MGVFNDCNLSHCLSALISMVGSYPQDIQCLNRFSVMTIPQMGTPDNPRDEQSSDHHDLPLCGCSVEQRGWRRHVSEAQT